MTTIIVHGTFAPTEDWYWNSWYANGFCQSLSEAMMNTTGQDDVWRVRGVPVSEIEELNPRRSFWTGRMGQISQKEGHFIWSGDYNAISRKFAAADFAKYLNVIFDLTNEPIRVIAHSHGCNVVKQASSSSKLNPHVYIGRAVFLACPIFSPMNIAKKDHLIYDKRWWVKSIFIDCSHSVLGVSLIYIQHAIWLSATLLTNWRLQAAGITKSRKCRL